MAKGYDPYNNPGAKPRKPAYARPSPNNPYNNAGPKVKGSGPKGVQQATSKTVNRVTATTGNEGRAATAGYEAGAGQSRKVKRGPSKIGWAKAGGPKAGPKAVPYRINASGNPVNSARLGTPSKPGGAMVKWGTAAAKKIAHVAPKLASTARVAGSVAMGVSAATNVVGAASLGWAIGTEIYNRNAIAIQDKLASLKGPPVDYSKTQWKTFDGPSRIDRNSRKKRK
jgi:hypothetical protein